MRSVDDPETTEVGTLNEEKRTTEVVTTNEEG